MKKVFNWLKKRPVNKSVIIISVAAAITQLCLGNILLSVAHSLVALSWFVVEVKDSAIETQCNTISLLMRDHKDLRGLLDIKKAANEYWFFKFCLERTKVDFCKRKISCSKFIEKLQEYELVVDRSKALCEQTIEEYEKPQGVE